MGNVQWLAFGYFSGIWSNYEPANDFTSLDYVGFIRVSHYAPLGTVGPCGDTWSAAYQMNAMVDVEQCSQDWPGTIPHMIHSG